MVNCGYQQGVVVKESKFVVVSDLNLKRMFRKVLEKLVIYDKLTSFNTKRLEMDRQGWRRLNN